MTDHTKSRRGKTFAIAALLGTIIVGLVISILPARIDRSAPEFLKQIIETRETARCNWLKNGESCSTLAIYYPKSVEDMFANHAQACEYSGVEYSCYTINRHLLKTGDSQEQVAAFGQLNDRCAANVLHKSWDSCSAVVDALLAGTGVARDVPRAFELAQNRCGINSDGSRMREKSDWLGCGKYLTALQSQNAISKNPQAVRNITETAMADLLRGGHRDNQTFATISIFAAVGILWPEDAATLTRFTDLVGSSCAGLGFMDPVIRKPTRIERFDACRIQRDMNTLWIKEQLPHPELRSEIDEEALAHAQAVLEDQFDYKPAPLILMPFLAD